MFQIDSILPSSTQGYRWRLLYSTVRHGFNLLTFYARAMKEKKTLTVVETLKGEMFGGFTSTPWEVHQQYFGTGESFLFKFDSTRNSKEAADCRFFPWTGENNLVMMATDT